MNRAFPLRSLIKSPGGQAPAACFELSADHAASMPQWKALALRAAEELSGLLGTPTGCEVELAVTDHRTLRRDDAGLLLPLEPTGSGAAFRLPGDSPQQLAGLLLRDSSLDDAPENPEDLDAQLAMHVAALVSQLIETAFDIRLKRGSSAHALDWPLTAPPAGPRLVAEFVLSFGGGRRAALQIIFPGTEAATFARLNDDQPQGIDLSAVGFEAEAVLATWRVPAAEMAAICVGASLSIPGGSLEAIRIETTCDGKRIPLGRGKLGDLHGQRNITLTS